MWYLEKNTPGQGDISAKHLFKKQQGGLRGANGRDNRKI